MPHNLTHIKEMIDRCQWQWAKTYESCPHEYIVRGKCELTDEEFLAFVDAQRCMGTPEQWGKYNSEERNHRYHQGCGLLKIYSISTESWDKDSCCKFLK